MSLCSASDTLVVSGSDVTLPVAFLPSSHAPHPYLVSAAESSHQAENLGWSKETSLLPCSLGRAMKNWRDLSCHLCFWC